MDIAHPTDNSAGLPSGELVPNTPAGSPATSQPASPPPVEVRPVVNIKRGSHTQIIYSRPVDPSVRVRIVRKKSPWLFYRPWLHKRRRPPSENVSQTSKRRRRRHKSAVDSSRWLHPPAAASGAHEFRPHLCIIRTADASIPTLPAPASSRQCAGRRPTASQADSENRRLDPPAYRTPPVHWTIPTPESRPSSLWQTDGEARDGNNPRRRNPWAAAAGIEERHGQKPEAALAPTWRPTARREEPHRSLAQNLSSAACSSE